MAKAAFVNKTRVEISDSFKERITKEVEKRTQKGLRSAVTFLRARLIEQIGVQVPYRKWRSVSGKWRYHAKVPNVPDGQHNIRKLSGQAQKNIWAKVTGPYSAQIGTVAMNEKGNYDYAAGHERTWRHPNGTVTPYKYLMPMVELYRNEVNQIVGLPVEYKYVD